MNEFWSHLQTILLAALVILVPAATTVLVALLKVVEARLQATIAENTLKTNEIKEEVKTINGNAKYIASQMRPPDTQARKTDLAQPNGHP